MRDMRDSGVEWIGEVPANWEITRIKNCFELRNERNYEALEDVNLISLYTDRGVVQHCDLTETTGNKAVTADGYKLVYERDIVVNIILCWMGAVGMSKYNGVTSPAYDVYKPIDDVVSEYYHYLFRTPQFNGECYRYGRGIMLMRWRTYSTEFGAINIPLPPRETQLKIVEHLDQKCGQIDALIANVQAQIEKLKAYKQSVITEVVTKGLDPSAPMKDSGVDWIGEIPMHWNIVATKYLFEIFSGATPKSEIIENWDEDIIWITPADYKTDDVFVSCGRRNLSEQGFASCSTSIIPVNSIIFSKRAPIGAVAINTVELCTNQGCLSCVNKDESNINAKFFYYVMAIATEHYELLGSGTTFKEISASNFANFVLPWPAIDEQIAMVEYLDDKCTMIAQLIAIKQKKINKLTEYKKSIIYEYVTGKKEVS
ncbi:restriction endonuclease subunit S [Akkermansia sp.]|uniref:restriction endonuclease subunit S n=1 Tax=Akkermansia sp. TaxID=1872421 RepID=UPI003AB8E8D3